MKLPPHHVAPFPWKCRTSGDFSVLSTSQAREHYDWFMAFREQRVVGLLQALTEPRTGYDLSVVSEKTGDILKRMGPLTRHGPPSEHAVSVGLDAMLIVTEQLVRQFPSILYWDLAKSGPKTWVDRLQPVLRGFKDEVVFGPIHMGSVYASAAGDPETGAAGANWLWDVFTIWRGHAAAGAG